MLSTTPASPEHLPTGLTLQPGFVATPLDLNSAAVQDIVSTDPRVVRVPPGVLSPGNTYTLRFSGWLVQQPSIVNLEDVAVTAVPSPVVSVISGGNRAGLSRVRAAKQ